MLIKRKENKTRYKKSQQILVGSLLILLGIGIMSVKCFSNLLAEKKEDKAISEFYTEQEKITELPPNDKKDEVEKSEVKQTSNTINYVAILKIPKINLERGLSSKDSYYNNVNRNIEILEESDLPDKEKGNVILASHSGNGRTAYFKNLYKIKNDDIVSIFYSGYEYRYKVVNSYDVDKTGTAQIVRNFEKNTLTLITCRHNTKKQIIIICEFVEKL